MLDHITPVILTCNEEANIGRTLSQLGWAKKIIVVDSFSTDKTPDILKSIPNVSVFTHEFKTHAEQWNYAIKQTGIDTEWVLALDADYVLSDEIIDEMKKLQPGLNVSGYMAKFIYCIDGQKLRGSLYPPVTVLYKCLHAHYAQDGHTQRVAINGVIESLNNYIYHDDRKSFSRWLQAQKNYMKLEAHYIHDTGFSELSLTDKVRKTVLFAPFLVFFYCLVYKKLILDGLPGLIYSAQRTLAEFVLSFYLARMLII